MLRISFVLMPSHEVPPPQPETSAAPVAPPAEASATETGTSSGAIAFHGMRFEEQPLTARERAAVDAAAPGELGLSNGLVVVSDAELEAVREDGARLGPPSATSIPLPQQHQQQQQPSAATPHAQSRDPSSTAAPPPAYAPLPVERLTDVELCVASPAVTEEWSQWETTPVAEEGIFGSQLYWQDLSANSAPCGVETQFVHVYALAGSGPGAVLSYEMGVAVCLATMRMLRHQLRRLLCAARRCDGGDRPRAEEQQHLEEGDGDSDDEDVSALLTVDMWQTLRRCCQPSPQGRGGLRVLWDAALVAAVASTIRLGSAVAEDASSSTSEAQQEMAPEEEAAQPQADERNLNAEGMEAWSDSVISERDDDDGHDGCSRGSEESCPLNGSDVEGRAVWRLRRAEERAARWQRRQAAAQTPSQGDRERDGASLPALTPPPASVVAPLVLRDVPIRRTALALRLTRAVAPLPHTGTTGPTGNPCAPPPLRGDDRLRIHFMAESVAAVRQSAADAEVAAQYAWGLYEQHVSAAEHHMRLGTASLQSALKVPAATESGGDGAEAQRAELLREALQEYMQAAQLAQLGLLAPFRKAPRRQPIDALWDVFDGADDEASAAHAVRVAAEASRAAIYASIEEISVTSPAVPRVVDNREGDKDKDKDKDEDEEGKARKEREARVRFCQRLLSPMAVPGEAYYNDVMLRVHGEAADVTLGESVRCGHEPSLTAAREATQWRRRHAALPLPSELALIGYALTRLAVTATANAALVVLTLLDGPHRSSSWSMRETESYAAPCERASALALSLLRWHEPLPSPTRRDDRDGNEDEDGTENGPDGAGGDKEVVWCFAMYCKLRLRGARLFAAAGSTEMAQRWRAELTDSLARWGRHRHRQHRTPSAAPGARCALKNAAAWTEASTSPEAMVCRIAEEEWNRLAADVRAGLQRL